ncbi:MAG: sensor histidine kinase [Algiphilus sp.]
MIFAARTGGESAAAALPDFCRLRRLAALALIVEIMALVFALIAPGSAQLLVARFVLISAYLQTISLLSAGGLCLLRRWMAERTGMPVFLLAWGLIVGVAVIVSALGYSLSREVLDPSVLTDEPRSYFILRNAMVAGLLGFLVLRYFSLRAQWEEHIRADSEVRYQSLSARIRPHFLFNCLNSIAALIAIKPAAAETMVEDLADLFRASLAKGDPLVTMAEEIDLVRKFARIEQTRLGARLGIDWDVAEDVMPMSIPRLTIQPLVENAVHHGAARSVGAVTIVVRAVLEDKTLVVEVINPLPPADADQHEKGSGTAIGNIAQRVRLLYGAEASLELHRGEEHFCARLQLPARPLDAEQSESSQNYASHNR